jgi:predicted acyltransferase
VTVTSPKTRFEALDVLRGLAVLGMAFSGMVPYRSLPAWMYHAQLPPPDRNFNPNIFGLTWVDTIFPFFLFSMGAAIPLALGTRSENGTSNGSLLKGLLGRGLTLAIYALVGQHLRPFVLADAPGPGEWLVSLSGFVLVSLILIRWPSETPVRWRRIGTTCGWIGAALVIAFWNYPDETRGFANYRNDVILMVLANVAVSGGAIWLWTKSKPAVRWIVFASLIAIFLTNDQPGLGKVIWNWDPSEYLSFKSGPYGRFLPILYHFEYHKYLLIVLPGTFAGDLIRATRWNLSDGVRKLSSRCRIAAQWTGPVALLVACVGLTARDVIASTILLTALALTAIKISANTDDPAERLAHQLFSLGAPLLILGLLAEPLGGGIRKDSATLSYFLVTSGLGTLILGSLAVAANRVTNSAVWRTIRDTGVNPILGYLVITNLVWGIVGITQLEDGINGVTDNPLILTTWGLLKTVFVACITAWITRRKLFLRA